MKILTCLICTAALFAGSASIANADRGNNKGANSVDNKTQKNPIVGSFISRFTIDTVSFPGTPDIPCQLLIGNPATPFVTTCSTAAVVVRNSDGTDVFQGRPLSVFNSDPDDDLSESELQIASQAVGTWRANTRSTYQARSVSVGYDANGNLTGYQVVDSRAEANSDYSGLSGTFDSRSYDATQDPLDPNEPFTARFLGTLEWERIE